MSFAVYLKKSPITGTYSFRMRLPKDVQGIANKLEVKKALKVKDKRQALVIAMKLHADTMKQIETWRRELGNGHGAATQKTPVQLYEDALKWMREEFGTARVEFRYPPGADDSGNADRNDYANWADYLAEKDFDGGATPLERAKFDALIGKKRPAPKVKDAFDFYLAEKNDAETCGRSEADRKSFEQHIRRNERYLIDAIGDIELAKITREEARLFRDYLRRRKDLRDGSALSIGSINRSIQAVRAVLNFVDMEWQLNLIPSFKGMLLKDDEAAQDKRKPFTFEQLRAFVNACQQMNDEARIAATIITFTGCRIAEVQGLEISDLSLENAENVPHLIVRRNSIRSLKTSASERRVPLIGEALEAAREALAIKRASGVKALFPRYGLKPRGEDALSKLLNDALRKRAKVTDKKLTVHSCRHLLKDLLKNRGVSEQFQKEILGHTRRKDAADGYGSRAWLEVLREAMEKAWQGYVSKGEREQGST